MPTIPVITDLEAPEAETGTLGILDAPRRIRDLDTEKLRQALSGLSQGIGEMLRDVQQVGGFRLKEVQVSVEISAEGGVALVGRATAGAKGAINLTFAP